MNDPHDPTRFLRLALRGNGAFSLTSGIVMLVADGLIEALLGAYGNRGPIHFVGANLLAFGALLFFVASRERIAPWIVKWIVGADVVWVVATVGALSAQLVKGQGASLVAGVGCIVLLFAILQRIGLHRAERSLAVA